jgi:hypothetical protein
MGPHAGEKTQSSDQMARYPEGTLLPYRPWPYAQVYTWTGKQPVHPEVPSILN